MSAPSVLEYARAHGLAIDHTKDDLLKHLSHLPADIEDDTEIPGLDFSLFDTALSEPKLQGSKKGATMLLESMRDPRQTINWKSFLPRLHRVKKLKAEEPILFGDHETDVRRFRSDATALHDTGQLWDLCPTVEIASESSFDAPWRGIERGDFARSVEQEVAEEKCSTTKEVVLKLGATMRMPMREEEKVEVLAAFFPCPKKPRVRSITPPLMYEEDSPGPYIPSSSDLEFPLRSDEALEDDSLLLQIDKVMQEKDQIRPDEADGISCDTVKQVLRDAETRPEVNLEASLSASAISPSRIEQRRAKAVPSNLKLDVPLIASSPEANSSNENECQNDASGMYNQFMPVAMDCFENGLSSCLDGLLASESTQFELGQVDEELTEEFFNFTDAAREELDTVVGREKIGVPADCLKYPVPPLEPVSVVAPWDAPPEDFLAVTLGNLSLVRSDGAASENEKRLSWQAIPSHLMRLGVQETIEDDGAVRKWIDCPQKVTQSQQMLYKRPGLRILDLDDESDEELEEDPDLLQQVSKPTRPSIPLKRPGHMLDSIAYPVKKSWSEFQVDRGHRGANSTSMASKPAGFSTADALGTFLDLRGGKFRAPTQPTSLEELADDPIQPTQAEDHVDVDTRQSTGIHTLHEDVASDDTMVLVPSTPTQEVRHSAEADGPNIATPGWPRAIVIDISVLQKHRSLINFLEESRGSQVNIVYRDLNKLELDNSAGVAPELILDASTGLIITSWQALTQRALPGQGAAGHGVLQSRVLRLAAAYDRLFVLIMPPSSSNNLSQTQVDTMSAFAGFSAGISTDNGPTVIPIWVSSTPGAQSTDDALNEQVSVLVCRHAFPSTNPSQSTRQCIDAVNLINDETIWERFLRRIGLNAMAAQIVIGALRRADPPDGNQSHSWGLRKFVQIQPDERADLFGETIGRRTMQRINEVLEKNWA